MAARQPPALMEELVEEILLRVPPDEPERLMRAAVVCKPWCRLVCGPGFRRRFRERHGAPPLLGIISNRMNEAGAKLARFVPTGSFRPPRADRINWLAIDSRHGRVLLRNSFSNAAVYVAVWDPITDELLALPKTPWMMPSSDTMYNYKGAVLCAADGCDHLDCHGGPFLVVFVGVGAHDNTMSSYVYSSEANAWSEQAHHQYLGHLWESVSSTLVENALYFVVNKSPGILKYNLGTRETTAISCPTMTNPHVALMVAEGGGLGCATIRSSKLCLWSQEVGPGGGHSGWALDRTIELSTLVPAGHSIREFDVASSVNGGGIIHVGTYQGCRSFTTDLKSGKFSEVGFTAILENMVPFISFYTPGIALLSLHQLWVQICLYIVLYQLSHFLKICGFFSWPRHAQLLLLFVLFT
jgi:hypothetical protein